MDKKRQSLSLKFVVVGDPLVGKTSLLLTLTRNYFSQDSLPPTVAEKYYKEIIVDDVKMFCHLWDTPSIDGYENFRKSIYPQTHCFIVCYAINNPSSFSNLESVWLPEIFEKNSDAVIILVGTKSDLESTTANVVSETTAKMLMDKYKMEESLKCSSLVPETVEKVFKEAIQFLRISIDIDKSN